MDAGNSQTSPPASTKPVNQVEQGVIETNVAQFLENEKRIKEKQKELKELRAVKKTLEEHIISFMHDRDIPQFQFKDGDKLKLTESVSKKSIGDKWLDEKFNEIMSTSDSGELKESLETLRVEIANRETTRREKLKHSK